MVQECDVIIMAKLSCLRLIQQSGGSVGLGIVLATIKMSKTTMVHVRDAIPVKLYHMFRGPLRFSKMPAGRSIYFAFKLTWLIQ